MMRRNGLTKSLCFGAAASIGFVFAQHVGAPLVGSVDVLVFYLGSFTIGYAALLGSTPRRAVRNAAAALVGTVLVVMVTGGLAGLAIGLAGVLALVRSGLEYPMKPARGLVVETLLMGLSLGFAFWVSSPGWLGTAAGLWAFSLVQSLYFLVPGRGRRRAETGVGDPFESARERLLGLLEDV